MTTYCGNKDINKFIRHLTKNGWEYSKGKKHGKLTADFTKMTIVIPSSSSDSRCLLILKQLMKRHHLLPVKS